MLLAHLTIRLAAIALLCTGLYEGGQYVKHTLESVSTTIHSTLSPEG